MNLQTFDIPIIPVNPVTEKLFDTRSATVRKKTFNELLFKLLLINGPNLNMLGKRDPTQYGTFTLQDVEQSSVEASTARGYKMDCFQSNHEGAIIDKIHESMDRCDGIVINPGAFTHYSYAIYDALELCDLPVVEIHISDIATREEFRRISVISPACVAQVKGMGLDGYARAVNILCDTIENNLTKNM